MAEERLSEFPKFNVKNQIYHRKWKLPEIYLPMGTRMRYLFHCTMKSFYFIYNHLQKYE